MNSSVSYNKALKDTMNWLGKQPNVIILGQAVCYAGTGCFESLTDVPSNKKLEFPVAENFQVGVCIGLAINGMVPVCVIPRWNFLLCATDQIVNHLDKLSSLSDDQCNPRVIIRVPVGSERPVDPQEQHKGNFSDAFRLMCKNIDIVELTSPEQILPAYHKAYMSKRSSILVEFPDYGKP